MKILFLIDSLASGGAQRQMITIANLLSQKGYIIEILYYNNINYFNFYVSELVKINKVVCGNKLIRAFRIVNFIRTGQFNTVISFLQMPNFYNCFAASLGRKKWKVITSERSSDFSQFNSFKNQLLNWFLRFSDKIVCNSERAEKMWSEKAPYYKSKITTIYNTTNIPPINISYIPLCEGKLHLLIAASYRQLKNPINVIKALSMLNDFEKNKIMIDWYGDKDIENSSVYNDAVKLIDEYGLSEIIHLNDASKDILELINKSDCVGLFSRLEGLPNAICEGMKLGKPIIMTKVSDYSLMVDDSNGMICDWDNCDSIRGAFSKILKLSAEELIQLGNSSRVKADLMFSADRIIEKWCKIISD